MPKGCSPQACSGTAPSLTLPLSRRGDPTSGFLFDKVAGYDVYTKAVFLHSFRWLAGIVPAPDMLDAFAALASGRGVLSQVSSLLRPIPGTYALIPR